MEAVPAPVVVHRLAAEVVEVWVIVHVTCQAQVVARFETLAVFLSSQTIIPDQRRIKVGRLRCHGLIHHYHLLDLPPLLDLQ